MTTQNKLAEALRNLLHFEQRITACRVDGGARFAAEARAALAEHDAQPAPACPHCARTLEGAELARGLCGSDDCPRHDAAKALAALVAWLDASGLSATKPGGVGAFAYAGTEYSVVTDAREALAEYPDLPA